MRKRIVINVICVSSVLLLTANLFARQSQSRVPQNTPKVIWEVVSVTREKNDDVPVITKQLVGRVDNSSYPSITIDIQLTLTTPANAKGQSRKPDDWGALRAWAWGASFWRRDWGEIVENVTFRQHSGGHTPGPNWPTFLTFAQKYLQITEATK